MQEQNWNKEILIYLGNKRQHYVPVPNASEEQQEALDILDDYDEFLEDNKEEIISSYIEDYLEYITYKGGKKEFVLWKMQNLFKTITESIVFDIFLEDETKAHDLYISDWLPSILRPLTDDMTNKEKFRTIVLIYLQFKDDKPLARAIINRRNSKIIKDINTAVWRQ